MAHKAQFLKIIDTPLSLTIKTIKPALNIAKRAVVSANSHRLLSSVVFTHGGLPSCLQTLILFTRLH